MIVLSKFLTFTEYRLTSSTSPSAPYFGTVIQSPWRSMSFEDSCHPATKPRIVSLNTSIRIAIEAPIPAMRVPKDTSIIMLKNEIPPMK